MNLFLQVQKLLADGASGMGMLHRGAVDLAQLLPKI
jgi:hypothetical protein